MTASSHGRSDQRLPRRLLRRSHPRSSRYVTSMVVSLMSAMWIRACSGSTPEYTRHRSFSRQRIWYPGRPAAYHLWIFSSTKLNWQNLPPSFSVSLPRWLSTSGVVRNFLQIRSRNHRATERDHARHLPRNASPWNRRNRSKVMTHPAPSRKVWQSHSSPSPQASPRSLHRPQLIHEVTSPQAFDGLRLANRKLRRPDRHIATVDTTSPPLRAGPAWSSRPDLRCAGQRAAQKCAEFGPIIRTCLVATSTST